MGADGEIALFFQDPSEPQSFRAVPNGSEARPSNVPDVEIEGLARPHKTVRKDIGHHPGTDATPSVAVRQKIKPGIVLPDFILR